MWVRVGSINDLVNALSDTHATLGLFCVSDLTLSRGLGLGLGGVYINVLVNALSTLTLCWVPILETSMSETSVSETHPRMSDISPTVRDLYVRDLWVRDLCIRDLYVRDLCVQDLCVRDLHLQHLYVRDLDVQDLYV